MPTVEEPLKDLDKVKPIDHGVIAKPHTPVYKMHRYFARRPYTVFNELIRHYSNPGSIVLDPMCGGGVTIVEGLRLRRKVIGVDLDPMAIFITKCEVMDIDLNEFKQAFWELSEKVKDEINSLYLTKCPKCGNEVPADWFEWSNVVECPKCHKEIAFAQVKKLRAGTYECNCGTILQPLEAKLKEDKIIRLSYSCGCGAKGEKGPQQYDFDKYEWIKRGFWEIVRERKLWYPADKVEDVLKGWVPERNRLLKRGIRYFYELFTARNLLALLILKKEISEIKNEPVLKMMNFVFTSSLKWAGKLCHIRIRPSGQEIIEGWATHAFWPPDRPLEINVWDTFARRYNAVLSGKEYTNQEIGLYFKEANSFEDLQSGNATCWLLNKSATNLKEIPDNSVDVIITDPPYGGNVNYLHLSSFWAIWLRRELGLKEGEILDTKEEAIVNEWEGKDYKWYRQKMYEIFKECYRVLKPNRYMVMTFHNREFQVWNAIHLAAHDAGFIWSEKDGMIYQPPIELYTTTIHQKEKGALLGDFILSYKKAEKPPEEKWIEEVEIGKKIKEIAGQAIEYHGGARLSTIYMRLMPFLLNSGLLEKMTEKELEPILNRYFVKKDDKWYFPEFTPDRIKERGPEYYAPVETRIEFIIRRFLYAKHRATMDEILEAVYSRLINSDAAEYEEIVQVLNRICIKVSGEGRREVYQLKEERDKELLFPFIKEEYKYSEQSDHDLIIEQLVRLGKKKGYESHIGLTEQRKYKDFREMSIPMGSNVQYGLPLIAFNRIREIDVLWIKGISIIAAFEVEISTSIVSGINRFRELFAATPALNIPAYLVVPDKRERETRREIGSLANRRAGITERIKYILFSDIMGKEDIDISKVAKRVE